MQEDATTLQELLQGLGTSFEAGLDLGQHCLLVGGADELGDDLAGRLTAPSGERFQTVTSLGPGPGWWWCLRLPCR